MDPTMIKYLPIICVAYTYKLLTMLVSGVLASEDMDCGNKYRFDIILPRHPCHFPFFDTPRGEATDEDGAFKRVGESLLLLMNQKCCCQLCPVRKSQNSIKRSVRLYEIFELCQEWNDSLRMIGIRVRPVLDVFWEDILDF